MTRLKLTSPGVLLILAVLAAAGIFLLDMFFLNPHIESQKWAALREEAMQTERAAQEALRSEQEGLLSSCAAWARSPAIVELLRQPAGAYPGRIAQAAVASAAVDVAWVTDPNGRLRATWSAEDCAQPVEEEEIEATVKVVRAHAPETEAGLARLSIGPILFARCRVTAGEEDSAGQGYLYLGRGLNGGLLTKVSSAVGGRLVLVSSESLPKGVVPDNATSRAVWLAETDHLAVAWLAHDISGQTLGYFLATVPVVHIHRQAVTSRRMVLIILSLSVGLALLVILGTHMLITGPVVRLLTRLQRLESGEGSPESLAHNLHGEPLMLARRLESAFEKLAHISKTDELTGLANRRHFEEVLECFYHQARRYSRPLSVIVMDVDFFKAINDAGGHQAGDEILKKVSGAIEEACRKADLPARCGGDEFAVLLPETASGDAEAVAERIRKTIASRNMTINNLQLHVTTSMGIADLNAGEMDGPEAMISLADRALYAAKQAGRNRVVQAHDLNVTGGHRESENGKIDVLSKKLAGLDTQFKDLFLQAIDEVMVILQERDPHMANHTRKVQHYATLIAEEMELPMRVIKRIEIAAMMHDIGMLAMPDAILLCPTELELEQSQVMRRHPLLSVRIMERMEFLEQEIPAVRYHHERYDGRGYPEGISGATIPLTARILAVADAFDAITSPRTFREAMSREDALEEIRGAAGTQFDPAVVDAFLSVAERLGDGMMERADTQADEEATQVPAWRESLAAKAVAAEHAGGD